MKLPIPDDWQGEWCNWSICWPDSPAWEAILMGFVTLPQRGRTWDERTGDIRAVQTIGRIITDENLPLRGCLVSCRDDSIGDAIRYLADRVANLNFCCNDGPGPGVTGGGTGGSGGTAEPPSEVDDGDTSGTPPEGFDTWQEYFSNKCASATWIVNQWQADLERAQQINFYAGMTLTVVIRLLALALLTPIPGDEVVLMAATVIAAIGAGLINSTLEALEAVLTGFEAELVCSLYEATSVESARSGAYGIFDTAVNDPNPLVENWAKSLTRHWLTNDNLNRLFEKSETENYPPGDCSECEQDVFITVEPDTDLPAADVSYTGTAIAPKSGFNVIRVTGTRTDAGHYKVSVRTPDVLTCIWMGFAIVSAYLPQGYVEGNNCNNDYVQPEPEVARNLVELLLLSQQNETFVFDVCLAQSAAAVNDWIATL